VRLRDAELPAARLMLPSSAICTKYSRPELHFPTHTSAGKLYRRAGKREEATAVL
jgi:hypothetical protein